MEQAILEQVYVHPVKSLDATPIQSGRFLDGGGLEWDRRYAMVDADGEYVNGKRERAVHRLRAAYDFDRWTIRIGEYGVDRERTFHLEDDRDALASWLSEYVGYEIALVRDDEGGFPDDTDASGPTVVAASTLEAVAGWFDGVTAAEMRRRLRPNLVVGAVEAFWEDRLYDEPGLVVPVEIGDVRLHGVNPCQRCVVPTRDPDTGEETRDFRRRFLERREATLPPWAGEAWFDHYYRLMVNTHLPEDSRGERIAVGDRLVVGDARPDPRASDAS